MGFIQSVVDAGTRNSFIKNSSTLKKYGVFGLKLYRFSKELLVNKSVLANLSRIPIEIIELDAYRNVFCGYYDVSPFRPGSSSYLLLNCNNFSSWIQPSVKRETDLVLYHRVDGSYKIMDSTKAWNWQQGSRLQWLDQDHVIYNTYTDSIRSVVYNVVTGHREILPVNVTMAYKNQFIIAIDYHTLTECSEYGYPGISDCGRDEAIKRYWLGSGKTETLFVSSDISKLLHYESSFMHHINHILLNLMGDRFVFIYRFYANQRRLDSLLSYDFTQNKVKVLISYETISHYTWRDEKTLLFWGVISGTPGYYLINTDSGDIEFQIGCNDGHPNFVNEDLLITDISKSWQAETLCLYLVNLENKQTTDLLEISHPVVFYKTNRCDMHVSLSEDKALFEIDSRHRNYRDVIVGNLDSIV